MRKLIYILTMLLLWGCGEEAKHSNINAAALSYNDSAMNLRMMGGDEALQRAVVMLDNATAIDTNYYLAYWNKLSILSELKQYDKALVAAKHLIRANPSNPDIYVTAGALYDRLGDSFSAHKYYNNGLELYNKIFDTLSPQSNNYEMLLMNKGITLVMLGNNKEGNEILKKLYDKQADSTYKIAISEFMNKSKQELLDKYQPK